MKQKKKKALIPKLRFPGFKTGWEHKPLEILTDPITERVGSSDCIPYTVTSGEGLVSQKEKYGRTIAGKSLKNYYRLNLDDFAFNKSATKAFPQGYIARYQGSEKAAVPNSIFTCFRLNDANVDASYLDYLFQGNLHGRWLQDYITVGARAHGALNISDNDLFALPVPLPMGETSLVEQRKIADCLGSLDALIAAAERKLAALRDHKRGLMQQLFPPPGKSQPQLRFPKFRKKPEWKHVYLASICQIQRGKFTHRPRNDPKFFNGPYPFIQTGDVVRANGGAVEASQSLNELGLSVSKLFEPTIVLVTIAANIGDTGLLLNEACFTDSVVGLIPKRDQVIPRFLESIVRLKKEYLNQVATTGAQKNINNEILGVLTVSIPSIDEQSQIAECLTSLDTQITAQAEQIESLQAHKRGLMQQLFPVSNS